MPWPQMCKTLRIGCEISVSLAFAAHCLTLRRAPVPALADVWSKSFCNFRWIREPHFLQRATICFESKSAEIGFLILHVGNGANVASNQLVGRLCTGTSFTFHVSWPEVVFPCWSRFDPILIPYWSRFHITLSFFWARFRYHCDSMSIPFCYHLLPIFMCDRDPILMSFSSLSNRALTLTEHWTKWVLSSPKCKVALPLWAGPKLFHSVPRHTE